MARIDASLGFIHAINDDFFTSENNFLEEIDELLDLDFNRSGKKTVKKILAILGQDGSDQKNICIKTGLPSSTVSRIIDTLVEYEIVFEKYPAHCPPRRNREGIRYFMKDFFLNFYFQILLPKSHLIRLNDKNGLLFTTILSNNNYFILNFSDKYSCFISCHILISRSSIILQHRNNDFHLLVFW